MKIENSIKNRNEECNNNTFCNNNERCENSATCDNCTFCNNCESCYNSVSCNNSVSCDNSTSCDNCTSCFCCTSCLNSAYCVYSHKLVSEKFMVFNKPVGSKEEVEKIKNKIITHFGRYKHPFQLTKKDRRWLEENIEQFDKKVLHDVIDDSRLPSKPRETSGFEEVKK